MHGVGDGEAGCASLGRVVRRTVRGMVESLITRTLSSLSERP